MPPHELDCEAAVISAVLVDPEAFDKVADRLKPEHFYSEAHRRIFEAIVDLVRTDRPVDVVTVATWLKEHDRLAQVGGIAYLTEVLNTAPAVANVRAYADIIIDRYKGRQTILLCQRTTSTGYAGGSGTALLNDLAQSAFDLTCEIAQTDLEAVGDILVDVFKDIQAANARGDRVAGLPTGFDRYDRMTSGLHDGELTIVAARPGMGKTSLVLNVGVNVASMPTVGENATAEERAEAPVAFGVCVFSLEMDRKPVASRLLCSEARVDFSRMRTGLLTPADWAKLAQASKHLSSLPLWIDTQPAASVLDIRSKARRRIVEARRRKIKVRLVIVDYLQLMTGDGDSREQEVSSISRGMKQLAKELQLPVILLSQLNRAVETRGEKKKRPMLSDLRESGAIEQDADNVVFIYREDYYDKKGSEQPNIAELIIAKQRNGPTDTVRVRWDEAYTRFDNIAEGNDYGDH